MKKKGCPTAIIEFINNNSSSCQCLACPPNDDFPTKYPLARPRHSTHIIPHCIHTATSRTTLSSAQAAPNTAHTRTTSPSRAPPPGPAQPTGRRARHPARPIPETRSRGLSFSQPRSLPSSTELSSSARSGDGVGSLLATALISHKSPHCGNVFSRLPFLPSHRWLHCFLRARHDQSRCLSFLFHVYGIQSSGHGVVPSDGRLEWFASFEWRSWSVSEFCQLSWTNIEARAPEELRLKFAGKFINRLQ